MKPRYFVLPLAMLLPLLAAGQSNNNYRCTQGNLVRRVEIVYETGVAVPCEVHYHKDTEAPGQREVLWQAFNESGYCEARTREFVARLQGLGWACGAAQGADEAPRRDDTDVLGVGEASE
jgi:hypothetical protein